jgi:hypothetical protein
MLYTSLPLLNCEVCGRGFSNLRGLRAHKGRHRTGGAWTKEEIEILKEKYPIQGAEIPELLARHSRSSIHGTARNLGMRCGRKKRSITSRLKTAISRRKGPSKLPTDPYFYAWLAGFIEGDGTFKVAFKKKDSCPVKFEVIPSIELIQGVAKRLEMERVASELGKPVVLETTRGSYMVPTEHPVVRVIIHRLQDLITITKNILPHLRIKQREGEIFFKILRMMEKGEHLTKEGVLEIARLREQLTTKSRPRTFHSLVKIIQELR